MVQTSPPLISVRNPLRSVLRGFLVLLSFVLLVTTACRESTEIPYSVFKAHIAAGEVTEVRFSPGRLEAVPTPAARAAGAPVLWSTGPVASDGGLVPLLDAKRVQYRNDDS